MLFPLPLGPSTLTISRSPTVEVDPVERGDASVAHREVLDLEHQNSPTDPTAEPFDAEDRERGHGHQDHARGHRRAEVQRAGLSEQPEDRDRHRRRRRAAR